jgi:PAS domain S-box-containing protein
VEGEKSFFVRIGEYFRRRSTAAILAWACLTMLLIAVADYIVGKDLSLAIFYILPISLVVWFTSRNMAVLISILSSAAEFVANTSAGRPHTNYLPVFWHNIALLGFFLLYAFILSALRKEYRGRLKLISELNDTLKELTLTKNDLEKMSMELAINLSEVFEALKRISSGDPSVRIDEASNIELITQLRHIVNVTAESTRAIIDLSHEFAMSLAEYFDVLHKVTKGNLNARVTGISTIELLESLKKVMNETIQSISTEMTKRQLAEEELRKAHDELERRVERRTAQLKVANEKLLLEIEERKRVEEELRGAELRYRTVADFTHDWEYWESPDGKLRYISPSCERITGYKPELFLNKPDLIYEIIVEEDKDIWNMHRHDVIDVPGPRRAVFRIQRQDGKISWIEHVCQPVTDDQGNFLGVRAGNRDITIRKGAEKKLRDTLSLLNATLESTADGILVVNTEGKMVTFNQKFIRMWQIPESIVESLSDAEALRFVADQLDDPGIFLKKVKKLYDQPDAESYDILAFKDGRVFERYSQPQKIGDRVVGRVWSFRDITERKRAENALRESEQLLLQAHKMEAIGRLAAGVAHEINNPLAVINEKAGLIKDILELSKNVEENKEKFITLLNGIFENVNRSRTITHRLLGFSRRLEVTYELLNLNAVVKEVMEFLEKEILFRNIRLELKLKDELPKIVSDKGQLQQVLLNIINNAVDAVEKGGLIEISTDIKDENTVSVSVRDNGHGIPKEILGHIFEPFFTTKEKGKGTGLGLSISYGIVQKLGGTILVQSEVNKGTTFAVELPLKAKNA